MAERRTFLFAALLLLATVGGAAAQATATDPENRMHREDARAENPTQVPAMRIVTFGTSLTARGGWQPALAQALGACLGRSAVVGTVAQSGATSDWALGQMDRVAALKPEVVLVEFYANDAAIHRFISQSHSARNMAAILDGLHRRLPRARVIVMAMNPMAGMRGMIRPFIDGYIQAHRAAAAERGFEFIDLRPDWMALPEAARHAAIPDGAHPVPEAAARIIAPRAAEVIAGKTCRDGKL